MCNGGELTNNSSYLEQVQRFISSRVQGSYSYEIITSRIRSAKQVDDKRPKKVKKKFDHGTGEVFVQNTSLPKSIWSKSMAVTNHNWSLCLRSLYSASSSDLIDKVLDTNNTLVLDGSKSIVIVNNGTAAEEVICIKDIHPVLPESDDDIMKCILNCKMYYIGSHCYFGSGAARGEDIKRLPDPKHYQVIFNSLRYQLYSCKNENHDVKLNRMVEHWLSPIQTRFCVLQLVSLYPAVEQSLAYKLTDASHFDRLATDMFAKVMGMKKSISTKWCRDIIAQITNYIAPVHLNKTSTHPILAQQFHHSEGTHNVSYSSSIVATDPDNVDNKIDNVLIAVRWIWSALGDDNSTSTIRSNEVSIVTSQELIWTTLLRRPIAVLLQGLLINK